MDAPAQIPADENGAVLRRMIGNGDDLTQPRMMDFCHIFPQRRQALVFAGMVDDRTLRVCIAYNEREDMWDAIVQRYMIPTHPDITTLEIVLARQAESVGGKAAGWGCMTVKRKVTP